MIGIAQMRKGEPMGEKEYEYIYQIVKDSDGVYCYIKQGELIRCKDCRRWTKQEDSAQGRCELLGTYPTGGWYCANAKRRTNGQG